MEGKDVMKVEVYKERRKHWKEDREREERTLGEESEQYYFYTNLVSLGASL